MTRKDDLVNQNLDRTATASASALLEAMGFTPFTTSDGDLSASGAGVMSTVGTDQLGLATAETELSGSQDASVVEPGPDLVPSEEPINLHISTDPEVEPRSVNITSSTALGVGKDAHRDEANSEGVKSSRVAPRKPRERRGAPRKAPEHDPDLDLRDRPEIVSTSVPLETIEVEPDAHVGDRFAVSKEGIRYGHDIPVETFLRVEELKLDLSEALGHKVRMKLIFDLAFAVMPRDSDSWVELLNKHSDDVGRYTPDIRKRHLIANRVSAQWPMALSRGRLELMKAHDIDVEYRYLFAVLMEHLVQRDRGELIRMVESST